MSETREQQARELVQWLTNPNPRFNALSYAEQEKRILERVVRALAACARDEAKWWFADKWGQVSWQLALENPSGYLPDVVKDAERIATLERAAGEGKS